MSDEKESAGLLPAPAGGIGTKTFSSSELEAMGLAMPLVEPTVLRAAFAERERIITSILDPNNDFLYSVRYADPAGQGKVKQAFVQRLDRALELAKATNGEWSAHPTKSGCLKLAHALGIESRRVEVTGLPVDQRANWSSCRYIARHRRTGREEEGQGYCDGTEKGGKMAAHAIISMADTRAYCHAVLRCAGYDKVGADSMVFDEDETVTVISHDRRAQMVVNAPPPALATSSQASGTIVDHMGGETASPETAQVESATVAKKEEPTPAKEAPAPAATQEPAPAAAPAQAPANIRVNPDSLITNAQAAALSNRLLTIFGSKPKASAWLVENAGVERSIHVTEDKFNPLMKKLDALEAT
jgi:hypothetical protein